MVVIGVLMLRPRKPRGNPDVKLTRETMARMLPTLPAPAWPSAHYPDFSASAAVF
jgi:hypothetical protein